MSAVQNLSFKIQSVSEPFVATAVVGTETLSKGFEFTVEGTGAWDTVPELVGKTCAWHDGRWFHGRIASIETMPPTCFFGNKKSLGVRMCVRPTFWFLSHGRRCRIFEQTTAVQVIKSVLSAANISYTVNAQTHGTERADTITQYQESDAAFVERLSATHGLFSFFTHASDGHTLVFADDASRYEKSGVTLVRGKSLNDNGFVPAKRSATSVGSATLQSWDWTKPTAVLEASACKKTSFEGVGVYSALDETLPTDADVLKNRAKTVLEPSEWLCGTSACPKLAPGHTVELDGALHVVVSVSHGWTAAEGYKNAFESVLASETVRPAPVSAPHVFGLHTALVVGKENVSCDEQGRVQVQFPWDRDHKSGWLRVAQASAGNGWGHVSIPRVGQEVLVSFLYGNPDQGVVVGALYNGANVPPYIKETPAVCVWKTETEGENGYSELAFFDKKDHERVVLSGFKDVECVAQTGNFTTTVKKGQHALTVEEGSSEVVVKKGDLTVTVSQGKVTINVQGAVSLSVGGDHAVTVRGNLHIKSDVGLTLEAPTISLKGNSVSIASQGPLNLEGATADLKASAVASIKGALVKIN